jgi:ACT domain-containing protein
MPRVITQADLDAVPDGAELPIEPDTTVPPLAAERAAARNIRLVRGAGGGNSGGDGRDLVRAVTRAVVDRVGAAGPAVVEAVVAEVLGALGAANAHAAATPAHVHASTTPRGASLLPIAGGAPPGFDYCAACVEQERTRARGPRAVLTTTGKNTKGIVARVTSRIADMGGDILDISQTLVGDWFTMIIVVDVSSLGVSFEQFQEGVVGAVRELGCQAMMMHEDVMSSLHRV